MFLFIFFKFNQIKQYTSTVCTLYTIAINFGITNTAPKNVELFCPILGSTSFNYSRVSNKRGGTFINFIKNFQPICLFLIVCFSYTFFCIFFPWRCRIITQIVSKCHGRANLLLNLQKIRIIEKISTQYTIISPNMFIIFWDFFHPIRLFHTIRLFFWSKCPPNTVIPYPTVIRYSRVCYSHLKLFEKMKHNKVCSFFHLFPPSIMYLGNM